MLKFSNILNMAYLERLKKFDFTSKFTEADIA